MPDGPDPRGQVAAEEGVGLPVDRSDGSGQAAKRLVTVFDVEAVLDGSSGAIPAVRSLQTDA
jgi:hypothetical protein